MGWTGAGRRGLRAFLSLHDAGGHLEAGQIAFRVEAGDERIRFEIESWARSGDRVSDLLYDRMRMSKEIQLHMWISFLERVIRMSGGQRDGGLRIDTRRVEDVPAGA